MLPIGNKTVDLGSPINLQLGVAKSTLAVHAFSLEESESVKLYHQSSKQQIEIVAEEEDDENSCNDREEEDIEAGGEIDEEAKKDSIFPLVDPIDAMKHKQLTEEYDQEQAIWNELVRKRYQGFNA